MNWSDERYVRVYTRDTPEWQCLSFPAQGLFCLLLRKVNRAGVLPLGRIGRKGVAVAIGFPGEWARLEPALDELVEDGCVVINDGNLAIPNFIEAQECEASDKARAKKHREIQRDRVVAAPSRNVTPANENVGARDGSVTPRDGGITGRDQTVTPSLAVPSRAVPPGEKREATVTRLPSKADLLAKQYPATAAICAEGGFSFPSKPETRESVEAAIVAVGHGPALDAARASFSANGKTHLGWHLDAIRSATRTVPTSDPVVDLSWVTTDEAREAWEAAKADVTARFKPDAHPRALASAAAMLREEFNR